MFQRTDYFWLHIAAIFQNSDTVITSCDVDSILKIDRRPMVSTLSLRVVVTHSYRQVTTKKA